MDVFVFTLQCFSALLKKFSLNAKYHVHKKATAIIYVYIFFSFCIVLGFMVGGKKDLKMNKHKSNGAIFKEGP